MVICIKRLRLETILGVYEHERVAKRPIVIDVQVECDTRAAVASDRISDTIDYKSVRDRIIAVVERSEYRLLEALADAILRAVTLDPRVQRVWIEVEKPSALRLADSISVLLPWKRQQAAVGAEEILESEDALVSIR